MKRRKEQTHKILFCVVVCISVCACKWEKERGRGRDRTGKRIKKTERDINMRN